MAPRKRLAAAGAAAALAAVVLVALLSDGGDGTPAPRATGPTLVEALPLDARSPRAPAAPLQRVLVALSRPALGEVARRAGRAPDPARAEAYVRSLEREAFALRGALKARGVRLRDVVPFARTWNGFAATVRERDLARLDSLGVRVLPVRRFYPAAAGAVALAAPLRMPPVPPAGRAPVALLDSGVDARTPPLRGRVVEGYDAVGRDAVPAPGTDPRSPGRRDEHGTELAGVLAGAGERVLAIRVAGLQADPGTGAVSELATTDQLLAGLERAVDPNGDGDPGDHAGVALVGVNAPFAGFAGAPEAQAAAGAAALGTLVVAPAGNEGPGAGADGTVGSPAAAPSVLAVGALTGGAQPGLPRLALHGAGGDRTAVLLGGDAPRGPLSATAPLGSTGFAATRGRSPVAGRIAVVRAGPDPDGQAAAAATAGAAAVLLVAGPGRRLPAVPRERTGVPVLGIGGGEGQELLGALHAGDRLTFGPATVRPLGGPPRVSPASARGPSLSGAVKPDLVAPGTALTAVAGGGAAVVSGTSVAAARAAAAAAALRRREPDLAPGAAAAALTGSARPAFGVRDAGAGALAPPRRAGVVAPARAAALTARAAGRSWRARAAIELRNLGSRAVQLRLASHIGGARVAVAPRRLRLAPGASRTVTVSASARGRRAPALLTGRLRAAGLSVPLLVRSAAIAPPPLGPLQLTRSRGGAVDGVRFAAGAFRAGVLDGRGTRIAAVGRLSLALETAAGRPVRLLTPARGARDLLPGEYAYALPPRTVRALAPGRYRFVARAIGPRGGPAAVRRSTPFSP